MNKILIALFSAGLLAFAAIPSVTADETRPHCEEGQPAIGYSDRNNETFQTINNAQNLGNLRVCEGEHWDGQDPVDRESYGGTDNSVCPASHADNEEGRYHVSNCQSWETHEDEANVLVGRPLTFRVSALFTESTEEVFIGLNINPVGQVVLYFGHCEEGGQLESGMSEEEQADEDFELPPQCESETYRVGAYIEDSTPGNLLAEVVSTPRVTRGHVDESDCTQEEYERGAYSDKYSCGRDNTAITAEWYPTLG